MTAFDHFDFWQKRCQSTCGCRLCRTAFTTDEHATNSGIDSVKDERAKHGLLTNNSGKWINTVMVHSLSFARQDYSTAAVFFNEGWMVTWGLVNGPLCSRSSMVPSVLVRQWSPDH